MVQKRVWPVWSQNSKIINQSINQKHILLDTLFYKNCTTHINLMTWIYMDTHMSYNEVICIMSYIEFNCINCIINWMNWWNEQIFACCCKCRKGWTHFMYWFLSGHGKKWVWLFIYFMRPKNLLYLKNEDMNLTVFCMLTVMSVYSSCTC